MRQLRSQLDDKVKEVEALNAAKLKLKSELAQRVKTALERYVQALDLPNLETYRLSHILQRCREQRCVQVDDGGDEVCA